jgi:hypothetical protein
MSFCLPWEWLRGLNADNVESNGGTGGAGERKAGGTVSEMLFYLFGVSPGCRIGSGPPVVSPDIYAVVGLMWQIKDPYTLNERNKASDSHIKAIR